MQQFVVPQFIDVEDKIFGPITTRQFLILLVAGLIIFLGYKYADFALFVTLAVVVGGIAIVFSFLNVNGQPFHYFLLNILQTTRRPSLRVWRKFCTKEQLNYYRNKIVEVPEATPEKKKPKSGHIRDLALVVNTGGFYRPEDDN